MSFPVRLQQQSLVRKKSLPLSLSLSSLLKLKKKVFQNKNLFFLKSIFWKLSSDQVLLPRIPQRRDGERGELNLWEKRHFCTKTIRISHISKSSTYSLTSRQITDNTIIKVSHFISTFRENYLMLMLNDVWVIRSMLLALGFWSH